MSISSLPRVTLCPGSAALPQANTTSVYAESGNSNHAANESAVLDGRLDDLPPKIRALIPDGAVPKAEVRIAYNWATDSSRLTERPYVLGENEIGGTIDLLIAADGNRVTVVDYKLFEDVGLPDENEQVMGYALAAARLFGADEVTVVLAYLGHDAQDPRMVVRVVDALDLDAFASKLRGVIASVRLQAERAVPDVRESRWCKHCPAAASCPAKVALIKRLANGGESNELELLMPLSAETAALAYERLGYARNLLRRIESAIYAYAAETPIPLSNGMVLGKTTKLGNEKLDGDAVHEVVKARHGQAIADAAVVRSATKVKLKEALRFVGVKSLAAEEKAVLDEVRAKGGAVRETKETIEEYRPQIAERAS